MMNNSMFSNLPVERELQTAYGQNLDVQTNLPQQQSSTMTVSEVMGLMGTYISHMKIAVEMGRAVRNDEIEQLKAENEQLRLKVASQQKEVNPRD
ncbi:hypothetical protein [Megasphaera stantonii]|jgi:hypothetical protein|uniref:hypothetical protein n=1 Tax=Megasphaera stantonii TaxID=2144175 RepID=UPI00320A1B6D